jgi:hypothetical protein
MSEITIHFHPKLAEEVFADGVSGARAFAALSRQAIRIVQWRRLRDERAAQSALSHPRDSRGRSSRSRCVVQEKEREQKPPLKQRR